VCASAAELARTGPIQHVGDSSEDLRTLFRLSLGDVPVRGYPTAYSGLAARVSLNQTRRMARCVRESYSHEPSGKGDGSARKATRTAHPRPYLVNYKCTYGETVGRMLGACGETAVGRKADLGSEWLGAIPARETRSVSITFILRIDSFGSRTAVLAARFTD
jgi:hypothetical protein